MSPDDKIRLRHMVEAGETALDFCRGRTRSDLDTDTMLRFALTRAVEIVGEAAANVSDEGRTELPHLPWPAMVGMRNRLVHAYFDVDRDILWTTVMERLPPLVQELKAALAKG